MATSPLLFALYLDSLLKKFKLHNRNIVAYADDIVFVAHSWSELRSIMSALKQMSSLLNFNKRKSGLL